MHPQHNYMIAQQRIAELAHVADRRRIRNAAPVEHRDSSRSGWIAVGAVLMGAGWGSNQFPPMLLVYRHALGLGAGSLEAMFGVYALGLIPGLFVAGRLSDARGRRLPVLAAAMASLPGSLVLIVGASSPALLYVGRFVVGLGSGAAFSAGTAGCDRKATHASIRVPGRAEKARPTRRA